MALRNSYIAGAIGFFGGILYKDKRLQGMFGVKAADEFDTAIVDAVEPMGVDVEDPVSRTMRFGFPSYDTIRTMKSYVLSYDRRNRVPNWVFEHLTPELIAYDENINRSKSEFFEDNSIHVYFRSTNADYKHSGFDRGHLAAAGNHRSKQEYLDDTFVLSNITPQATLIMLRGGVGTSGSEKCRLHEDQAQDALDRPVIEKTTTLSNLSSDDSDVRVLRPRGERLNPAFVLQRHTTPTAGLMVWGAIAYNIRSPIVLIRGPVVGQGFNRSAWKKLEMHVRKMVENYKNVYVVTGPLYMPRLQPDGKKYVIYQVIGPHDVAVPTHFFKIAVGEKENDQFDMEAYVMPNAPIDKEVPLKAFAVPRDVIERYAGFLLFEKLPNSVFHSINGQPVANKEV
ncbi:endonuclease G, mitochondrial [Trichonephila clavipes]|nr:endonuclease G, mitochondrial [Trichonephila clavipes]